MTSKLDRLLLSSSASIREAMTCLQKNAIGIALIVDEKRKLLGTITDGDIRRAILSGDDLDAAARDLLARKATIYREPVTAPVGTERSELLRRMRELAIRHIPLLDPEGCVVELVTLDELVPKQMLPLQAVIMAGGLGTRLRPLTEETPKPMLPVGDRPIMELIIEQLREAGIRRVNVTTHYRPEKIISHFGDGEEFGVELNYVAEDRPLGTAGALGLMDSPEEPLLVMNGDILTRVNFRSMLNYHRKHGADLTVAVRKYDLQVPYGVIECQGPNVSRLQEKPSLSFLVNAGIYLLEPIAQRYIANGEHIDMTDLIERLIENERTVVSFPIVEYWLDIGQHADYERAQEDVREGRFDA